MNSQTVSLSPAARELVLYADNTPGLDAQRRAILRNLSRRIAHGNYHAAKAAKLWRYWTDAAARMYNVGYDRPCFRPADRQEAAAYIAAREYRDLTRGHYATTIDPACDPAYQ